MKRKYFYSHIIATADISLALADVDMPNEDRIKLIALAEENLHHAILDSILSQLPEEDKKIFLKHVSLDEHENAWKFINETLSDAENIILKIAKDIKDEMHTDIKNAKK
jgi:hypothetical protein